MHLHILGICGSFMGGIAAIAKSMGHRVTGSDTNVYPPMSTQLEELGIQLTQGYDHTQFEPTPDIVIIGNAMSRGNPAVEFVLDRNLPYTSGPQWLLENLLKDRWVIGVAGTHGKTTTSSMLAWILDHAGLEPGFLIGGIPENFGISARLGASPFFVIEADEYDSAFFDKRSKFVHYRPKTLVLNNLEFDHADIFDDLAAIQKQFHHLMRMLPATGLALSPADDRNIEHVLAQGCWSERQTLGKEGEWNYHLIKPDGSEFELLHNSVSVGVVHWSLIGAHNVKNAVMAIAAAHHAGVQINDAVEALGRFKNVKRRMEIKGQVAGAIVYDDFAHHPTAIKTTVQGLRQKVASESILAVVEPRSNTMKMGVHKSSLADSWADADHVFVLLSDTLSWSMEDVIAASTVPVSVYAHIDELIDAVVRKQQQLSKTQHQQAKQHVLVMSNGGFGGIHQRLLNRLKTD